jgi:Tol biopolymer transport system component
MKRKFISPFLLALCAAIPCGIAEGQPVPPAEIESLDSAGNQGNGPSGAPAPSEDGRLAVFASEADNLVPLDTNKVSDVFLRDRGQRATVRLSLAPGPPAEQGDLPSDQPAISLDGFVAAFRSLSALLPGDRNRVADVYLVQLKGLTPAGVELASTGIGGAPADGPSSFPALDGKGQRVAFLSSAGNLAAAGGNGKVQVYVRDRASGKTELASLNAAGKAVGADDSSSVALSRDGRFVAFSSLAEDLVEGDRNKLCDIFARTWPRARPRWSACGPTERRRTA